MKMICETFVDGELVRRRLLTDREQMQRRAIDEGLRKVAPSSDLIANAMVFRLFSESIFRACIGLVLPSSNSAEKF